MYLDRLVLTNFRNYEKEEFQFSPQLNLIAGLNGMGKTNLLDAVYYCCMGKSHFSNSDRNVVRHNEPFFRLESHFVINGKKEKIVAKVQPSKTKVLERNGTPYERLADHVGLIPVVFKTPSDTSLALEGSEERRRFMDNTLCQIDAPYLHHLIQYNKVLQNRNALLKQFAEQRRFDAPLLEVYNQQLLEPSNYIFAKRQSFTEELSPVFEEYYQKICSGQEKTACVYRSQLDEHPLLGLLRENQEKDRILQRTTVGIHKDDLQFRMNERPVKTFASQGQLKSFVLALKLAQHDILKKKKGLLPLLLLDDLFDKLDEQRVRQLLQLLVTGEFGQVFITDTHPERCEELAKDFGSDYKKFIINMGNKHQEQEATGR